MSLVLFEKTTEQTSGISIENQWPPSRCNLLGQELVKKILLELDEIMDLLLDVKVTASMETSACTWIRNNRDRWDRWIASVTDCVPGQGLVNADGDFVQNRSEAREFWKLESKIGSTQGSTNSFKLGNEQLRHT